MSSDTELLALVKMNLRITTSAFDVELNSLISQAKQDLADSSGSAFSFTDLMEVGAVVTYCRAKFGAGDEKMLERYQTELTKIGIRKTTDVS